MIMNDDDSGTLYHAYCFQAKERAPVLDGSHHQVALV